jgi:hypothetical protein
MKDYVRNVQTNPSLKQPVAPPLGPIPKVPDAVKVGDDLSGYIDFLHPWGNVVLNPLALMLMFFLLVVATIVTLRAQDIG